jgi:hypothetical protein
MKKNFFYKIYKLFKKLFFYKKKNNYLFSLQIELKNIKYFLKLEDALSRENFIWSGDWDKRKKNISTYRKYNINYNSIFQIYRDKIFYKKSDEYKYKSRLIKKGKKIARGKTIEELDEYFLFLDDLKNSLKNFGYQNQIKLKSKNKNDEIGVVIGRDGEIIKLEDKFGGTHRFGLCKVLNIKKVYINVKAIHDKFIKKNNLEKKINIKDKKKLKSHIEKIINK